jgi:TusA-related sulfurtransferase
LPKFKRDEEAVEEAKKWIRKTRHSKVEQKAMEPAELRSDTVDDRLYDQDCFLLHLRMSCFTDPLFGFLNGLFVVHLGEDLLISKLALYEKILAEVDNEEAVEEAKKWIRKTRHSKVEQKAMEPAELLFGFLNGLFVVHLGEDLLISKLALYEKYVRLTNLERRGVRQEHRIVIRAANEEDPWSADLIKRTMVLLGRKGLYDQAFMRSTYALPILSAVECAKNTGVSRKRSYKSKAWSRRICGANLPQR